MSKLIAKLHSRKFLLAVAAFVGALAKGDMTAAALVTAVYVAVEGYVDSKAV